MICFDNFQAIEHSGRLRDVVVAVCVDKHGMPKAGGDIQNERRRDLWMRAFLRDFRYFVMY